MKDQRNSKDRSGSTDYILEEYRRNERKLMENTCVTGSSSDEDAQMHMRGEHVKKMAFIAARVSLVLGFLVFLFLWLR